MKFLVDLLKSIFISKVGSTGEKEDPKKPEKELYEGIKVVIDPGHGGRNGKRDPGAIGKYDSETVYERDVVLDISEQLAYKLDGAGFKVVMTRIDNNSLSHLKDKVDIVNKENPEIFISIHANANAGKPAEGIETFYNKSREDSKKLAAEIQNNLILDFPTHKDRGIKDGSKLYVLRKQSVQACCLVECEFINHPEQVKFLVEKSEEIADAIFFGIKDYLNK
jgi:N-acetylmuramoyl-L-alanine amidase